MGLGLNCLELSEQSIDNHQRTFQYRREDLLGQKVEIFMPECFRSPHLGNALVRQTPFRQNDVAMDLALTLQRLYDSEINVTITMLWDGGFDFALISYMEWEEASPLDDYFKGDLRDSSRESGRMVQTGGTPSGPLRSWRRQFMTLRWASIPNLDTQNFMGD